MHTFLAPTEVTRGHPRSQQVKNFRDRSNDLTKWKKVTKGQYIRTKLGRVHQEPEINQDQILPKWHYVGKITSKSKLQIETGTWNSKWILEIETRNRNSNAKPKIRNPKSKLETWNSELKFETRNQNQKSKLRIRVSIWTFDLVLRFGLSISTFDSEFWFRVSNSSFDFELRASNSSFGFRFRV